MCQNFNDSDIVIKPSSQCLKITEKVSFCSASEASYIYTLSEQKFSVSRQKLVETAEIEISKWDILVDFQTLCFIILDFRLVTYMFVCD